MTRLILTIFAMLLATLGCRAQNDYLATVRFGETSEAIFKEVTTAMESYRDEPAPQLIVLVAKQFLGTEYVGGTLEIEPEQLTINMDKTDCILFVEMCLALVQTIKSDTPTFEAFCRNTQNLRYHRGQVDGYASRNHYTSAWIRQGEENGYFREVSKELGGTPLDQKFDFMTTHTQAYSQLVNDPSLIKPIRATELSLEKGGYYYLAQNDLPRLARNILSGDIICFVTPVAGLDIGHVAIAVEQDGRMHFIHASSSAKKVIIESQTIYDYVLTHKSARGIRVVRLN